MQRTYIAGNLTARASGIEGVARWLMSRDGSTRRRGRRLWRRLKEECLRAWAWYTGSHGNDALDRSRQWDFLLWRYNERYAIDRGRQRNASVAWQLSVAQHAFHNYSAHLHSAHGGGGQSRCRKVSNAVYYCNNNAVCPDCLLERLPCHTNPGFPCQDDVNAGASRAQSC